MHSVQVLQPNRLYDVHSVQVLQPNRLYDVHSVQVRVRLAPASPAMGAPGILRGSIRHPMPSARAPRGQKSYTYPKTRYKSPVELELVRTFMPKCMTLRLPQADKSQRSGVSRRGHRPYAGLRRAVAQRTRASRCAPASASRGGWLATFEPGRWRAPARSLATRRLSPRKLLRERSARHMGRAPKAGGHYALGRASSLTLDSFLTSAANKLQILSY